MVLVCTCAVHTETAHVHPQAAETHDELAYSFFTQGCISAGLPNNQCFWGTFSGEDKELQGQTLVDLEDTGVGCTVLKLCRHVSSAAEQYKQPNNVAPAACAVSAALASSATHATARVHPCRNHYQRKS